MAAKKKPAKKKTSTKPAKKTAAKKTSTKPAKKAGTKPAKKAAAKPTRKAPKAPGKLLRGRALAEVVIAHLAGPKSPIGEPRPLSAEEIARCEADLGVALSPFMHAVFSFDVGWLARNFGLFDDDNRVVASAAIDVIKNHAGPFGEFYEPWCAARFGGKATELDAGSDSMRFVYYGAPDEHGEYPVLGIDHDDMPLLEVAHAGFDLWMAEMLGLSPKGAERAAKDASRRLLGQAEPWEMGPNDYPDFDALPALAPAPAPGSVEHPKATAAAAPAPAKQRKLTVAQITKALRENARAGRIARLGELIAEARARGMAQKALDDALVEACLGKQRACVEALLAAGASPNAKDGYGGALTRAITYEADIEIIRALLDAGASPDSPGVNGETAIFQAVERGDEAIVRLLIARGADVSHHASNELSPLHTAVREQKDPRFVDILCEAGARPGDVKKQTPALVWAAEQASVEHVRRLLAHGAPVDQRAAYLKQTALHAAFSYGRDDVAAVLIQAGADRSLRDERGISFERIYAADGSDARSIAVRYVPSAEPQTLTIAVELAVTNQYQAPSAWMPALDGATWERLVAAGVAAEAAFAPEASRAEVIQAIDRQVLSKPGFHRLALILRVAGVSEGFVRSMCLALLGGTRVLTGAGMESVMRVTALDVHGSIEGGSVLDLTGLRAWADGGLTPGVWPEPLPFPLAVRAGDAAEIAVFPQQAARKPQALNEAAYTALTAWLELLARVPPEVAVHDGFRPFVAAGVPTAEVARFSLVDLGAGPKTKGPLRLPWSTRTAAAQLGQVMRALHARTPLAKVELALPEA
jgi:hypothetical protein